MPPRSSIVDHDRLPEDREVGRLRRDRGVWDWDEHRETYDRAARRAMALLEELSATAGLDGAIARGLFSIATSSDEDHFAIRLTQGQTGVYKWPTVPSAEESRDVILVGAFLGARERTEQLLEPSDIPLAVQRALVIGRNVPVLICVVTADGLLARRFRLRREFFERLMSHGTPLPAAEPEIELGRWATLLGPDELSARFRELAPARRSRPRRGLREFVEALRGRLRAGD
jgi:hypothetical protein